MCTTCLILHHVAYVHHVQPVTLHHVARGP